MFLFLKFSSSSFFTIDFGSFYTKSAFEGKNKNPEIGTNIYSKRLTPSFVAFKTTSDFNSTSEELLDVDEIKKLVPVIGEQAISVLSSKPWLGSGYLQQFIDIDINESRNVSQKLKVTAPNDTRFKLFNLTSTFLHFYSKMVLGQDRFENVATTLVVPGSFSQPQINWITDAAQHAKLKNITTVYDWEAVANLFAQRRPDIIQQSERTVLFVDAGATSTKAYSIKFVPKSGLTRYTALLKSYHIDYDAGGAYVTSRFAEYLKSKIKPIRELTPAEESRIVAAAENGKKQLSLIPKVTITIDDVCGKDHTINVAIDEFNKIAKEQVMRMVKTASLEVKSVIPDFVEVIGGSSRIPMFKEELSKVIAPKKFGTSLNADEALAMGGEYYALKHFVGGQMNASFYGVSLCEYFFCHDLLIGLGTDLGFNDNPEVVYFNITTPLRRGIETYNWSYYAKKPINGFTNYFFFKRNPVQLLYGQQCYASSCKNQTVALIKPDYGRFVSILELESKTRHMLEFETNELEEKYIFICQEKEAFAGLSDEEKKKVEEFKKELKDYLWNQKHTLQMTKKLKKKFETINQILKGQIKFINSIARCKEAVERGKKIINVIYPSVKDWLREDVYEALKKKVEETEAFLKTVNSGKESDESVTAKAVSLETWCDSLPDVPKLPVRGDFKKLLFKLVNKFLDYIEGTQKGKSDDL